MKWYYIFCFVFFSWLKVLQNLNRPGIWFNFELNWKLDFANMTLFSMLLTKSSNLFFFFPEDAAPVSLWDVLCKLRWDHIINIDHKFSELSFQCVLLYLVSISWSITIRNAVVRKFGPISMSNMSNSSCLKKYIKNRIYRCWCRASLTKIQAYTPVFWHSCMHPDVTVQ